ncbi:MAG: T9SS type A sorting domain-containing protein [Williamsia sp.]|nr:T9SS type A sorting domain-containing protein [Williamsia sp.]
MKHNLLLKPVAYSFLQLSIYAVMFLCSCLRTSAQAYYSNFAAPAGNYNSSSPSGCIVSTAPGFTDDDNIADADLTNYAEVSSTLGLSLLCSNNSYAISSSLNFTDGSTQAPAGYLAGFHIQLSTVTSLSVLQNNLSIQTYLGGNPQETASAGSLLGLNLLTATSPGDVFFTTTLPFDSLELDFNTAVLPVGVAYDYRFFYAFGSASLLPLKLTAFSAVTQAKDITLSWATASQSGEVKFEVERSHTNSSFIKIAEIKADNILRENRYSFTDNTATDGGTYLYRLKMVDQDGTFTYSKVILADKLSTASFKVYPTYVTRGQRINVFSNDISNGEATLVDATGKMINRYKFNGRLSIPSDDLKQGIYLLNIGGERKSSVVKILVR